MDNALDINDKQDDLLASVKQILASKAVDICENIRAIGIKQIEQLYLELDRQANERHAQIQYCAQSLYDFGATIDAKPSASAMWLQFCFEVSYGCEESPADFTDQLCARFTDVNNRHGEAIARALFEMPHCILPSELAAAAQHLHSGGDISAVLSMANDGRFTPLVSDNPSSRDTGPVMGGM